MLRILLAAPEHKKAAQAEQSDATEKFSQVLRSIFFKRRNIMNLMDTMMEFMIGRMDKAEKEAMMDRMMDKMLADFTVEEKQKLIETMMPKMMEGVNLMEIMPKMMMQMMNGGDSKMGGMGDMSVMMQGTGSGTDMPIMPKMMTTMMPECLNVMLPYVPTENRTDFAARIVATLMEKSSEGMSEEEENEFMEKIQELVKE